MINNILIRLAVLTVVLNVQPYILTERSSAEETQENQLATTEVLFSEKMPQRIDVVDVDFDYYSSEIPPMREISQFNNIVPEWNYGLFGETCVGPLFQTDEICFFMWLMATHVGALPSDDPTPWRQDGMCEYIATHETSMIQQKLGNFFCNYGALKKGDIFPLADRLYYVDDYLSATVVSQCLGAKIVKRYVDKDIKALVVSPYLEFEFPAGTRKEIRFPIRGLCIPLTSGISEAVSQADFSYLPGINLFVSRIYLVPTENSYQYVARICTQKNIVDVTQFEPFARGKRPGLPLFKAASKNGDVSQKSNGSAKIQKSSNGVFRLENERVEVQEVAVGDIIKGDKVGYRVLTIVPPDQSPWRAVFDRDVGESRRVDKGRLIGWVELDPNPIPLGKNGAPIDKN